MTAIIHRKSHFKLFNTTILTFNVFQGFCNIIVFLTNNDIPTDEWVAEEGPSMIQGSSENPLYNIAREEGVLGPPTDNTLQGKDACRICR